MENIDITLKDSIKNLAINQKWLKNQRKTVYRDPNFMKGYAEGVSPAWACNHHSMNKYKLHILYCLYAELRGKTHAKKNWDTTWQEKSFNNTLEKYKNHYIEEVKNEMQSV